MNLPKSELIELLLLLESLAAMRLVERYKGRDARAVFRWLTERCRTYDPEAEPDKRSARLLPPKWAEVVLAVFWARDRSGEVPKSRRTRTTWGIAGCCLLDALFFPDTRIYAISEVESKSMEIIDRISYMFLCLDGTDDDPEDIPIRHLWKVDPQVSEFKIEEFCGRPWNSSIVALAQGESAFRQYGGSVIWIDEAGVQGRWRGLLQTVGPASRRIVCTGTLEKNRGYTQRCGEEELSAFDDAELGPTYQAEVPALPADVADLQPEDQAARVHLWLQQEAAGPGSGAEDPSDDGAQVNTTSPIKRIARGVHHWMRGDRDVFRISFRSDPDKDTPAYVREVCSKLHCTTDSPEFHVEMKIDPEAEKGERRFPTYVDSVHGSKEVPVMLGDEWIQAGGADYGFTNPTAMILASWNGHWLRVWGSHQKAKRNSAWHKAQVCRMLRQRLRLDRDLSDEGVFKQLKYTFGDPTGAALAAEYLKFPVWYHITTLKFAGLEASKQRLNDRRPGENAVGNLLGMNGVCCGKIWYGDPLCNECGGHVDMEPGLLIDHSLKELRFELRTLRKPENKEGEVIDEKGSDKKPDHLSDALRYLCRALSYMMKAPDKSKKKSSPVDGYGRRRFRSPKPPSRSGLERMYSGERE